MFRKIPNILTFSRIIFIPLIIICYSIGGQYGEIFSAVFFLIAGFTDFLDGYLARTYAIQSRLGKFLDPIADKLLVGSVIILLTFYKKVDLIPAIAIICREILVSGLREFLADIRISVPVSNLAKVKTGFQITAIFMLLIGNNFFDIQFLTFLGRICLWVAAALTLFTGYIYLKLGIKYID